ncbi:hypothetical protein L6164_020436 [Bauhinia variegata]|uniref:Uncharacterized protein n=1 Tax=Bauhinia variegata TaxID=167791 RepID=A0ACB9MZV7_BAUVA|nr:hypothetical protein L6164_020436 [Bauhinia variegata]
MHRQSLGSPSSKFPIHGGAKEENLVAEETKRRDSVSSSFHVDYDDDNNNKAPRNHRLSSPPPRPEKLIHLIPILTLICFIILYLFSHSPSQSDLAQFNGFKHPSKHIDSAVELNHIRQYIDVKRSDVLPIRGMRNLQEIARNSPKSRPHRKFADF